MVDMGDDLTAEFPEHIGLMVLPWVSLFPGGLLPLRIFEERYRHMLRDALDGHRMFGIAHAAGDDEEDLEKIASIGVVRACVKNGDGTSSLILQGVSRVLLANESLVPYPSADISLLPETDSPTREVEGLRRSIHKLLLDDPSGPERLPKGFAEHLSSVDSPSTFADLLASTAVMDPVDRRLLLVETDVAKRMRILLASLRNAEPLGEPGEP